MNLFEIMTSPVSRMSYVTRYSSFPAIRRENVAEHSWWVTFISLLIAYDINYNHQYEEVNTLGVLERAILHDLSECISGDIIRSYKHTNPDIKQAMDTADAVNMGVLTLNWSSGVRGRTMESWDTAKDNTLEGTIVRFADMVAVVFYIREEYRSGNRAITGVLKEMYETWFHEFHTHGVLGRYADQMFPSGRWGSALRYDDRQEHPLRPAWSHYEGETGEHNWPRGEGQP